MNRRRFLAASAALVSQGFIPQRASIAAQQTDTYVVGLNATGGEIYNDLPSRDIYEHGYNYPTDSESLTKLHDLGIRVVQLPFRIERVLPDFSGSLNLDEIGRIKAFVSLAREVGLQTYLSPHNFTRYGGYDGHLLGSAGYPVEGFVSFWRQFAREFRDESGIFGYSLDTEPFTYAPFDSGISVWQPAAQAAVNAIRESDMSHLVTVPGADHWANAQRWRFHSEDLLILDPAENLAYEATLYGDADFSGKYFSSFEDEAAYPDVLVDRTRPFVEWLEEKGFRGLITEWGVPDNDDSWLDAADRLLKFLESHRVGSFAWAWGLWWPEDYALFISPEGKMAQLLGHYSSP